MNKKTELSVMAADSRGAELDAAASELFKNKEIVAPILKLLVEEFRDLSIEEIVRCFSSEITDDIPLDDIDVDIETLDPEMKSLYEKSVFFDSRFDMKNPMLSDGKLIIKLHFDLEIQNQTYESGLGYPLVKRGIYYLSRMISKQLGRLTPDTDYSELEKVYGIWICNHNIPLADRDTITGFDICKHDIMGRSSDKKSDYDLLNLIMVRRGGEKSNEKGLFEYLDATFKGDIEKMKDYSDIEWGEKTTKEATGMRGVAEVVYGWGKKEGMKEGIKEGIEEANRDKIAEMLRDGKTPEAIADFCKYPMELIKEVQESLAVTKK